jgi:hypothetical protein
MSYRLHQIIEALVDLVLLDYSLKIILGLRNLVTVENIIPTSF